VCDKNPLRNWAAISTQELPAKWFGPVGDGQEYHHIVTQGGANADNIPAEQLQNTDNIIRLRILRDLHIAARS
jgi:hypothetical protein